MSTPDALQNIHPLPHAGNADVNNLASVTPDDVELDLTRILYALSDQHRLGIVRKIHSNGSLSCTEAATGCASQGCTLPRATLSHHFRILRESGLIASVKQGQQHINTLRLSEIDHRFPGLLATILKQS